jgi:hypothetical protein
MILLQIAERHVLKPFKTRASLGQVLMRFSNYHSFLLYIIKPALRGITFGLKSKQGFQACQSILSAVRL